MESPPSDRDEPEPRGELNGGTKHGGNGASAGGVVGGARGGGGRHAPGGNGKDRGHRSHRGFKNT